MIMRTYSFPRTTRPRAVYAALIVGVLAVLGILGGVFAPVATLLGAGAGAGWLIGVSEIGIGAVVFAGFALAAGLLALTSRMRNGALAWILAVAASISALVVSLYPIFAVAAATVGRAQETLPGIVVWVQGLIGA